MTVGTVQGRDEFSIKVKEALGKRVGLICSICSANTSGPHEDPLKVTNIGVAAHISAAASGGPRYNLLMTPVQRKAIGNGIWLCQNCGKLIDSDPMRFGEAQLMKYKRDAELRAKNSLGKPSKASSGVTDDDVIRFFVACFDRPAFHDPIYQERSLVDFDQAMADTLTALSTGCLRARDGTVLKRSHGKSFLVNNASRLKMDTISQMIRAIRARFKEGIQSGGIRGVGASMYVDDHNLARWFDESRQQIDQIFSILCREAGVQPPSCYSDDRRS